MYCKYCGKQIDNDSIFCTYCGRQIASIVEANEKQPEEGEIHFTRETEIDRLPLNERTKKILKDKGLNTLGDVEEYDLNLRGEPGFGKKVLYDIEMLLRDVFPETPIEEIEGIEENTREYIQLKYNKYVNGDEDINVMGFVNGKRIVVRQKPLFIRARKLCLSWKSYEDMVKAITSGNISLPKSFHDIGGVTINEIKDFYKYTFQPFIKKALLMNEREVRSGIMKIKFPFLEDYQIEFIINFENKHNYTPIFYLLDKYVYSGRNRYNRIIEMRLRDESLSFGEIAEKFGLKSSERIRQIMAQGIILGKNAEEKKYFSDLISKNLPSYEKLLREVNLTPESEIYSETVEREHLDNNFKAFIKILEAIKPYSQSQESTGKTS